MSFWQATIAILLAVPLWAAFHPARQLLRDWLGRSRFVLSVTPGSFPIDRVNQVLGVNTHYITRYEAVNMGGGVEEVRLDFAGLTQSARTRILADLRQFAPESRVRLETGGAILQPVLG
ncbi:MAG TPA: hypothetical protein VG798_06240 [Rhizomicrobium sp.]|nr:hypothetical protein [Rhizomicrobium sp.]